VNLVKAVQLLADAGVDFVIIGGWSAVLHGSSYITNDLDICFARNRENCIRLAAVLAQYHPRLRDLPSGLPFVWDAATLSNGTIFTLTTDLGVIDLLAEVTGIGDFAQVKRRSVAVHAFDRDVWTLDLAALIQSKRAAGRDKDRALLPELEGLLDATEGDAGQESGKK
jgi:hypothetical protein